jgi:uncharacterized protein (DUF111 family)
MKQTAVDFAVEQLEKLIPTGNQIIIGIIIQKAKEMEKEQIKEAYKDGSRDLEIQYSDFGEINSEQYYNETYEKK